MPRVRWPGSVSTYGRGRLGALVRPFSVARSLIRGVRGHFLDPVLENITGLTLQNLADLLERFEAHSFHFARFEQRHVLLGDADALGELLRAHIALRQHDIEIDDDRHAAHTIGRWSSAISTPARKMCASATTNSASRSWRRSSGLVQK